jgi:hypothetical protein
VRRGTTDNFYHWRGGNTDRTTPLGARRPCIATVEANRHGLAGSSCGQIYERLYNEG